MPNTPPNNSTRRHFLCASAATVAAAVLPPSLRGVEAGPQKPAPRNAFSYRFNIGDIEAYSISDGSMLLREGLDLMWPEAARPTMRDDLIARGDRTDALPLGGLHAQPIGFQQGTGGATGAGRSRREL